MIESTIDMRILMGVHENKKNKETHLGAEEVAQKCPQASGQTEVPPAVWGVAAHLYCQLGFA